MNVMKSPSQHQTCDTPQMMYHKDENHKVKQMRKASLSTAFSKKSRRTSRHEKGSCSIPLFDISAVINSGKALSGNDASALPVPLQPLRLGRFPQ